MTRSPDRRRRVLDPDEQALWSKAMADVRPMRAAPRPSPRPAPGSASALREKGSLAKPLPLQSPSPAPRERAGVRASPAAPPPDRSLTIDKSTLAKLKRGDIVIDARIDLHGMTQAHAHEALDHFVDRGAARGARLLLVITGKGMGGDGVLRQMLPRWLRAGPHAARILRIEPAHVRHGGGGAWYVYLRKRREPPA